MFNKQDLLKNVKDCSEKILYAKVLDKALHTLKCFEPSFSDFFDPYKISTVMKMLEYCGLNIMPYGGYDGSERCMLGFFPDYIEPSHEQFPISVLEIKYNGQYSKSLTHREFLGSILGLGLDRGKVGDILIKDEKAIVLAEDNISNYILDNLQRVGRTKVSINILQNENYDSDEPQIHILNDNTDSITEKKTTVASLRLDTVLSTVFNMSRAKVADLIKAEKAFINWNVITNSAKVLCTADIITLRGIGRFKLLEVCGKSKKDRFIINVAIFK